MNILMLGSGSYKSSLTFRAVALGKQLAKKGHNVSLIVPSADKYNDFTPDRSATLDDVRLIQPWQLATRSAVVNLIPYLASSFVAILRVRPQLVYLYKPTPITILGLVPKLLFGTPVVLDLDDMGSEVMRLQGQAGLQVRLVAWCEKLALRHATAVVVASTYLQSIIAAQYPKKPTIVISNGVDVAEYPIVTTGKPRHALYYFGALNRASLVDTLLESLPIALAAVPDTRITIIGGGSALEAIKQQVRELGVESAVTFTGWIDMFAAPQYVQFADIAVCPQPNIPTVRAASNMKVFQYMAMGSVPVVSDVGDLAGYVRNGKAGIVVPANDASKLASELIALLQDDARRTRLAKSAHMLAKTDYAWSNLADTLADFLQTQLRSQAPQRKHDEK
jgi:glycosyltransferase involved in cell wall biosynthesis